MYILLHNIIPGNETGQNGVKNRNEGLSIGSVSDKDR